MGSTPDAPKPEDANITAQKQQELNTKAGQQSQLGSMVNQSNPFGSLTYSQTGTSPDGTPLYTATTKLTDANQQLLDILQGTQKSAGQQGQALIQGANYGVASPKDVIGDMSGGWLKDAMDKQMSYLQPGFTYDQDRLDTKLKNQGFMPGDVAYDKAMNALKQSQGQTITGFQASQQPELLKQAQSLYSLPAQLGAALSGMGSPTNPTFGQTPALNIQPANYIGATANAQAANQKAYESELAQNQSMMSGLFGIPTALLGGWAQGGGMSSLLGASALAGL